MCPRLRALLVCSEGVFLSLPECEFNYSVGCDFPNSRRPTQWETQIMLFDPRFERNIPWAA